MMKDSIAYKPFRFDLMAFTIFMFLGPPIGAVALWIELITVVNTDAFPPSILQLGGSLALLGFWIPLSFIGGGVQALFSAIVASASIRYGKLIFSLSVLVAALPVPIWSLVGGRNWKDFLLVLFVHWLPIVVCGFVALRRFRESEI